MPKKGREPAGLRRWRLAHRRKGKSHRSRRSTGGSSSSTPGFAATYQHSKTALQILSPVTDAGLGALENGSLRGATDNLKARFLVPGNRTPWLKGVGVSVLDAWGSAKIRHANALAQKSVTAWAPEVYAGGTALLDNDLDPRNTHADFMATTSGFDPQAGGFSTHGKLRMYLTLKYGGKGIRWGAKAFPAVGRPIKKAVNMLGLTL